MANRVILIPNQITGKLEPGWTRPRLQYTFEFPPEFTDTKVVLAIYHMGIYRASSLFSAEGGNFDHFTNPDPASNVLSGAPAHDDSQGSPLLPKITPGA